MIDPQYAGVNEDKLRPLSFTERIEVIDVLRGIAVGGILIGNMQWFSGYGFAPASIVGQVPLYDQITHFIVHFLIEGKFYSIFSFLFGFGFALQIERAEERGDPKARIFKRRLFWLLVIGLLHAFLLWAGDILAIYALMGFVLLLFRRTPNERLLKWAGILVIIPIFWYLMIYSLFLAFVPAGSLLQFQGAQIEFWNMAVRQASQGSYTDIVSGFNLSYIVGRYLGLIFDMRLPKILAMFLLGVYAYRKRIFQNLSENSRFVRRVMIWGLSIGLVGNYAFAAIAGKEAVMPPTAAGIAGVILYSFSVPALALGFAALIATLWQTDSWQNGLKFLSPVGRMALTNYLMQTIICVFIFYGYGFGLFGNVDAFEATVIGLAIYLFQIAISYIWLMNFRFGPVEWIWRQLTYRRFLPLRF
jgi:uncharacterized protein